MRLNPLNENRGLALFLSVFVLLGMGAMAAEGDGPNLLANPSFEGAVGETGFPEAWSTYGGLDGQRRVTVVEGNIDGVHVLRLEDEDSQGETGLRQEVPAEGGLAYMASVSVMALDEASPGGSYLQLRFSPSGEFTQRALIPGLAGEAATISVGKVAPPGTTSAMIYIYSHNGPTPKVMVDEVKLYTVAALPALMDSAGAAVAPEIGSLKPLYLETALVAGGVAAPIVVPADGRYDGAANRIADAIEIRTGVRPELVRDTAYDASLTLDTHAIVLGNRSTNSLIGTLYERYYTLLDLRYPGVGGYVARTLHNPTGSGKNLVLLGGSDDNGVEGATNVFSLVIGNAPPSDGELTIGRLMEIQLGDEVQDSFDTDRIPTWEDSAGYGSIGYFGWNSISKHMALYYMTGNPFHAREFIRLAFPDEKAKAEISEIDGERIENKDAPLSGPYHYNAHMMILYWDLIEESPLFTDEERLRVCNAFAKQLEHPGIKSAYLGPYAATPSAVGSRHGQWTAISLYTLGRYFAKDYDDPIWPVCEENGALHFKSLHDHAWVIGESDNLFWYNTATAPILTYMMLSGDRVPLENGVLATLLRGQEALLAGKQNDWALRYGSIGYYHKAADLTGDGRWLDYVAHSGISLKPFRLGQSYWPKADLTPTLPVDLVDKWTVHPVPEGMWQQRKSGLPLEESFQFASYRTAANATGDFILLDGLNGASRNPYHTFALLELRQDGETILEGYLNQLRTRADGLTEPVVAMDAALKKVEVLGDVAIAVAEVPNMPYASWKRTIVSKKGAYTVIADAVTPRIDTDNFEIELSWETKASDWKVDPAYFSRIMATKADDPAKTATIASSRVMKTTVNGMNATMSWVGPVKAGKTEYVYSVVGRGSADPEDGGVFAVERLAAGFLRSPEAANIDSGSHGQRREVEFMLYEKEFIICLGVRQLDGVFEWDNPVDLYWDMISGELHVKTEVTTAMKIVEGSRVTVLARETPPGSNSPNDKGSWTLGVGSHHLAVNITDPKIATNVVGISPKHVNESVLKNEELKSNREFAESLPLVSNSTYYCGEPVVDLIAIPHDDGPLIAAAAGKTIHLITPEGTPVRTMNTDGPIRMLRWWPEHKLLVAGCADEKVIAFNEAGERQWEFVSEMDPAVFRAAKTYWFKSAPGHEGIHGLHTDVFLDGKSQAFVGSACTLEIIDEHGQLIKRMPQFWGKVSLFKIIPTGSDTLTLLAARKYNGTNTVAMIDNKSLNPDARGFYDVPKGHTYIGGWSSMNRHHLFFEDFDGDGENEVMSEINGSWNRVSVWDTSGAPKYDVSFGPGDRIPALNIRDMDTADLDGDGMPEILVAEKSGLVVALTGKCERLWGVNVGGAPVLMNAVTPADGGGPVIVVALEDGTVKVLDGTGALLKQGNVEGEPVCLEKLGDGRVALALDSGTVAVFRL